MGEKPKSERRSKGIPREQIMGKLQDPSGIDIWGANDQQMPAGGEGLEGGAAGKFTRPYREGRGAFTTPAVRARVTREQRP